MKISGTQLAKGVYENIAKKITGLKDSGIYPKLVIVKSSEIPAVNNYVRQKVEKGKNIGIEVKVMAWNEVVMDNHDALKQMVRLMNKSNLVHGIIFQKPGDERIDEKIEKMVDPLKDVDGFLPDSFHKPPTYRGVKLVLRQIFNERLMDMIKTRQIVIIGKGKTGGAPIIGGLLKDKVPKRNIHIIDTKTSESDRKKMIINSDIVISAVGKPNPVNHMFFSQKTILIDIGVHFDNDNKIKGDFNEDDIKDRVAYYTTTPGGIGALTVAFLMDNVVNTSLQIITNYFKK